MKSYAYYGNYNSNEVFQIPITKSGFEGGFNIIKTGNAPYPVDKIGFDRILAITRKESAVTAIYPKKSNSTKNIKLEHEPRSSAFNPSNGLTLIAGKNKVMTSIMDSNNRVTSIVGYNEIVKGDDFGGSLACGHPKWIDNSIFFILNRHKGSIEIWNIDGDKLDSVNTPTSVHDIAEDNEGNYFGICEGNQKSLIPPSLIKFRVNNYKIKVEKHLFIPSFGLSYSEMGAHHIDIHPNDEYIYVGSTEGRLFVVDKRNMHVIRILHTGKGTGHSGFIKDKNLAVIINHTDTFVTIVDTNNNSIIKNITVADSPSINGKNKTIGHTFSPNPDSSKFYGSAPQDGKIFEIDLNTLELSDKLELSKNSNPLQGTFDWKSETTADIV